MLEKVAAIIVNYNMPERADALAEYIRKYVEWEVEVYLVDNGSDLVQPAANTTLWLEKNVQTTGGWLAGLEQARDDAPWLGYWFLITSAEFVGGDALTPMAELLEENPRAVGVSPALTEDSTTAWKHMITRYPNGGPAKSSGVRRTWMIDNIASLWRAEWLEGIGAFDPMLVYGWGVDLETCWKARREGRGIYIHEGCRAKKVTDIGYTMERMNMTAEQRRMFAGANMDQVLARKYGENWDWRMRNEYVEEAWR